MIQGHPIFSRRRAKMINLCSFFLIFTTIVVVTNFYHFACVFSAILWPNNFNYLNDQQIISDPTRPPTTTTVPTGRSPWQKVVYVHHNFSCVIHQSYKSMDEIPYLWLQAMESVKAYNDGCFFMFWSDEDIHRFISNEYPWFLSSFESYNHPIQRVDAFRYFALYHFGGIYLDADVGCKRSITQLLRNDVVLPETNPIGFSNDVLVAGKIGHPFFRRLIYALPLWNRSFLVPYLTVLLSTGPLFVTIQYHLAGAENDLDGVMVLHNKDYTATEESMFWHRRGSSWHQWDVKILQTLLGNILNIPLAICCLVIAWKLITTPRWRHRLVSLFSAVVNSRAAAAYHYSR